MRPRDGERVLLLLGALARQRRGRRRRLQALRVLNGNDRIAGKLMGKQKLNQSKQSSESTPLPHTFATGLQLLLLACVYIYLPVPLCFPCALPILPVFQPHKENLADSGTTKTKSTQPRNKPKLSPCINVSSPSPPPFSTCLPAAAP